MRPLQPLRRWLGLIRVAIVVQRDGEDVVVSTLPREPPVSVRLNTDETVSITIGHRDIGNALLAELRSLVR